MQIASPQLLDDNLPPDVQDLLDEMREAKNAKIEEIGKDVAKKRDAAVKGRKESGIEAIWAEDEEYYQGIDDGNRETHNWLKSPSTSGGISRAPGTTPNRCTSFFNITRQFVESASARMGDILLPAGDWNFTAKATPLPDGTPPEGMNDDQVAEWISAEQKRNTQRAEREETQLRDWLTECSYHTEVRKVIEDAAKLGTGVLKGPFPEKITVVKTAKLNGKTVVDIVKSKSPVSKHVDVWDFFPDPTCGEDIHSGNYVFERDRLTARQLRDLKGMDGYLIDQIDKVLDEGPSKRNYTDGSKASEDFTRDDDKFEVWYFHGLIDPVGMSAMSVPMSDNDAKKSSIPAVVVLVNDTPIKAFLNPLDTGEYPYDVMPWQRVAGSWFGIGVARQGRTAQDMLNGAARAMMDNAGLSSGPMLVLRQNAIKPADGKWEVTARKVWWATEQSDTRSAADAILAINIPMMQPEMQAIVQMAYKMMEDATGIFFIMQGQQGSAPDTVGGMELLHRNASAILRRLARVFDERVTEPHIRRYHSYLLLYGPENCKGDTKIEAIGSTALVEREIQAMQTQSILNASLNPAFGLDPEKAMIEVLKAQRFIPEKFTMDDEKKKKQAEQQPMIPAIEVAKIRAAQEDKKIEADKWKTKVATTTALHKTEVDTDRDTAYNESMARRDESNAQIRIEELRLKRELAMLDYANRRSIGLDRVKADLANNAMRLKTQKEMAGIAQVATPAFEPPGRAQPGHAFEE